VVAGVLVTLALAVVIGLLGGWARTAGDDVRVLRPGTTVEAAPFRVRVDRAEAVYELDGVVADEGLAYVVVDGELSLDTGESVGSGIVAGLFGADLTSTYDVFGNPSDEPEPTIEVAGDGSSLLGLGPGLTYPVRLVYQLDESAVPDRMTVTLRKHSWREFTLDGTFGWFDPAPSARVSLDVAALPAERPPSGDAP
jgi:hypothetical protein